MTGEITHWVEGALRPKVWTLGVGGVAEDLTGGTVALILTARDGSTVDTSSRVAIVSAPAGTVSYTPGAGDLVAHLSPYRATWQVTIGGVPARFPEVDPLVWHVRIP